MRIHLGDTIAVAAAAHIAIDYWFDSELLDARREAVDGALEKLVARYPDSVAVGKAAYLAGCPFCLTQWAAFGIAAATATSQATLRQRLATAVAAAGLLNAAELANRVFDLGLDEAFPTGYVIGPEGLSL